MGSRFIDVCKILDSCTTTIHPFKQEKLHYCLRWCIYHNVKPFFFDAKWNRSFFECIFRCSRKLQIYQKTNRRKYLIVFVNVSCQFKCSLSILKRIIFSSQLIWDIHSVLWHTDIESTLGLLYEQCRLLIGHRRN